jgi:maltose O-acetyltransferase
MLISFLQTFANTVIFSLGKFRARFYGMFFNASGNNVIIMKQFSFRSPRGISIGNDTILGFNCFLDGAGNLEIGDNCLLAQNVSIFTANHRFNRTDIPIKNQGYDKRPVVIGSDVWIGANVIILPGVKIGNGCVIGAGSVVTKNIPNLSVAAGVPARIVKKRKL